MSGALRSTCPSTAKARRISRPNLTLLSKAATRADPICHPELRREAVRLWCNRSDILCHRCLVLFNAEGHPIRTASCFAKLGHLVDGDMVVAAATVEGDLRKGRIGLGAALLVSEGQAQRKRCDDLEATACGCRTTLTAPESGRLVGDDPLSLVVVGDAQRGEAIYATELKNSHGRTTRSAPLSAVRCEHAP